MPLKSKNGNTAHDRRNAHLRERANRLIRSMASSSGSTREESAKAIWECALAVAERENLRFYKGTSYYLRRWLQNKQHVYGWALDVIELTLVEMEMKFREDTGKAKAQAKPTDKAEQIAEAYRQIAAQEPAFQPAVEANGPTLSDDPEISAMRVVLEALNPLTDKARSRVIGYLEDRYASES